MVGTVVFRGVPNQQESASRSASAAVSVVRRSLRPRRCGRPGGSVGSRLVDDRFRRCGCRCDAASLGRSRGGLGGSARSRRMGRAACMTYATLLVPWPACRVRAGAKVPVKAC